MRILVGVDGSQGASTALAWARDEAGARGCEVTALLAYGFYGRPRQVQDRTDGIGASELEAAARAVLSDAISDAFDALAPDPGGVRIQLEVSEQEPVEALLDRADEGDLIVVGARGLGPVQRFLLGSISAHIARHAHCPVVVVRDTREGREKQGEELQSGPGAKRPVVVGTDGSADSVHALRWASDHARARSLPLVVVQAWSLLPGPAPRLADLLTVAGQRDHDADELCALVARTIGPDVKGTLSVRLVDGQPAPVLLDAAAEAELLVVGSRGQGGFSRLLLGSTSATCVIHAPCSVALVPSPGAAGEREE